MNRTGLLVGLASAAIACLPAYAASPAPVPSGTAPSTAQSGAAGGGNLSIIDSTGPLSPFRQTGPANDLSGIWRAVHQPSPIKSAVGTNGAAQTIDGSPVPMTAAAATVFWHRVNMEQRGTPVVNTSDTCRPGIPLGVFSAFLSPYEIIQTPQEVVFVPELGDVTWHIYLNRGHPKQVSPSYQGDWVGHFEGPTLVADGVGFNALTWVDAIGLPHSERLHVLMRLTKVNQATGLRAIVTIEDPATFTDVWTEAFTSEYRPDMTMYEVHCLESVRAENNQGLVYEDIQPVPGINHP